MINIEVKQSKMKEKDSSWKTINGSTNLGFTVKCGCGNLWTQSDPKPRKCDKCE